MCTVGRIVDVKAAQPAACARSLVRLICTSGRCSTELLLLSRALPCARRGTVAWCCRAGMCIRVLDRVRNLVHLHKIAALRANSLRRRSTVQ